MSSDATPSGDEKPSPSDALSAELRKAAARSSLSALGNTESLDAKALIAAMGGVRGILEAILPGLIFLIAYTITRQLVFAIVAAGIVGVLFTIVRLIQRQTLMQAVTGLIAIGVSAALAALTGNAEDFYLPGFWTNGIYLVALAASIFARWPLVGVIVGLITGDGNRWRNDRALRRTYAGLTWMWVAMFAVRLAVQLPLYYTDSFVALGTFKLVLGIPLYAPLLVVTWLTVTALRKRRAAAEQHPRT
ncbi:DUF3159 domain-containing protein [Paramicrobacterium agarici]|uniref:DUF3159 domain-containing protein n=1 Tax=Paramicrobacterium agarici TaxID=630514 RepID=UPI001150798A|nr:DUF3159 domain-containing protein [Microbacterium agarici]TQO24375.1 uncharacterized protein DUF3159 [Microbacterium agarici]